jgi:hypothetical protein
MAGVVVTQKIPLSDITFISTICQEKNKAGTPRLPTNTNAFRSREGKEGQGTQTDISFH